MIVLIILNVLYGSIIAKETNDCDSVLSRCTIAVKDLKSTIAAKNKVIKKQEEVIGTQNEIMETQNKEINRSHRATKHAYTSGFSVSTILLLLLIL